MVIASVALATVAGFVVAVLPGGLGVREGVLMSALGRPWARITLSWRHSHCGWSGWPLRLLPPRFSFPGFAGPPPPWACPGIEITRIHDQRRRPRA